MLFHLIFFYLSIRPFLLIIIFEQLEHRLLFDLGPDYEGPCGTCGWLVRDDDELKYCQDCHMGYHEFCYGRVFGEQNRRDV